MGQKYSKKSTSASDSPQHKVEQTINNALPPDVLFSRVVTKNVMGTQPHKGLSFSGAMDKQREPDVEKILGNTGMEDLMLTELGRPKNKRIQQLGSKYVTDNKVVHEGTVRYNSTSTLFVDDTLHSPNPDDLLRCVATAMYMIVKEGEKTFPKTYYHVFSEDIHPISFSANKPQLQYPEPNPAPQSTQAYYKKPSVQDIYKFAHTIFVSAKLTPECAVVFLIYLERLLKMSGMTLDRTNWKWVWDDLAVWNVDFCGSFPNLTVQVLNRLEREILRHLGFTVTVTASEYAAYYFELRSLSEELRRPFMLKPLTVQEALKFQQRTFSQESTFRSESQTAKTNIKTNIPRVSSMSALGSLT